MSLKELYRDDLLNRFASHTFTELTSLDDPDLGDMTKVLFKDGSSVVVAESKKMDVTDAYKNIREDLVGTFSDVTVAITGTQRDALTLDDEFIIIVDNHVECYDGSEVVVVGGTAWQVRPDTSVQTTNATQTTIDSFTLDDEETYMVQINVVGTKLDGSERCGVIKQAVLYRDGGGATLQGNVTLTLEEYSDSNWDVNITVSGNDVKASVKGLAATTVNWKCSMQFIEQ